MRIKKSEWVKLKREWDQKLAKSGFNDIETPSGNLQRFDSKYFKANYDPADFKASERYYQLAGQTLHEYPFSSRKDFFIWRMHAEGRSAHEIAKALKVDRRYIGSVVDRVSKWLRI
jgi:hypothetical protein